MNPTITMDVSVLNRQRGNIKAQLTKMSTYLSEEADEADEVKINNKLDLILKVESKFDDLKIDYYKILKDEELPEHEKEFSEIDDSIQDMKDSGIQVYEDAYIKTVPGLVPNEHIFEEKSLKALEEGRTCIFHGMLVIKSELSEYFKQRGTCNFHISKNSFYTFPLLMALKKSLPTEFLKKFNYGLTRTIDADLSGKWFKSVAQTSDLCTSFSDKSLKALSVKKIYGVLIMWLFGIAASVVVLIGEIIVHSATHIDSTHRMRRF